MRAGAPRRLRGMELRRIEGNPLRHAAARGRVAARARRGERRGAVRPQVHGRGRGAGARRRGRRGRARARARADDPRARARRARPRAGRRGAGPGDPGSARARARGSNLGVDFLPGALPFNPAAGPDARRRSSRRTSSGSTRSSRTSTAPPQNTNMLVWHDRLWLIDHGAALYFHHAPQSWRARARAVRADRGARPAPVRRLDRGRGRPARAAGHRGAARRRRRRRARGVARRARIRGCTSTTSRAGSRRRAPSSRRRSGRVAGSPFSYAVYRVVPRVERGERMNVGVLVFSRPAGFLGRAHRARRRAGSRRSGRSSTRRRCARTSRARADRRGRRRPPARSRSSTRPRASTGSSRRRARSSSPPRCTPASAANRSRSSTNSFALWSSYRTRKGGELRGTICRAPRSLVAIVAPA